MPCLLEINLKSLQGVSVILDDEYAQRIEIKSVSSHTVWESASGILPAVKTRAVREKVAPLQLLALGTFPFYQRRQRCRRYVSALR